MLISRFKAFFNNEAGTIAVIMGASFVVVVTIVIALGVETSSAHRANSINRGALDSAVLAAASYKSKYDAANPTAKADLAKVTEVARLAYVNNLQESGFKKIESGSSSFTVAIVNNLIAAKACVDSTTYFSKDPIKACGKSAASFYGNGASSPVEVVFALDVSSSMGENSFGVVQRKWNKDSNIKITKVIPAIKGIVNKYSAELPVYWGLVPYRGVVNINPFQSRIVANDLNELDYSVAADDIMTMLPGKRDKYFNLPGESGGRCGYPDKIYGNHTYISPSLDVSRPKPGAVGEMGNYTTSVDVKDCIANPSSCASSEYIQSPTPQRLEITLMGYPLTERKDGTVDLTDDSPPVGNKKFKAYWHHDQKITFGVSHEYGMQPVMLPVPWGTACGRFMGSGSGSGGGGGGG